MNYKLKEIVIRHTNNGWFIQLICDEGKDSHFVSKTLIEAVKIIIEHVEDPFDTNKLNNVIPIKGN